MEQNYFCGRGLNSKGHGANYLFHNACLTMTGYCFEVMVHCVCLFEWVVSKIQEFIHRRGRRLEERLATSSSINVGIE